MKEHELPLQRGDGRGRFEGFSPVPGRDEGYDMGVCGLIRHKHKRSRVKTFMYRKSAQKQAHKHIQTPARCGYSDEAPKNLTYSKRAIVPLPEVL